MFMSMLPFKKHRRRAQLRPRVDSVWKPKRKATHEL